MADENILPRDQNHVTAAGFENSLVAGDVRPGQIIVATGRIKVDSAGGGGSGTVTQIDSDTGIELTPDPITTTGTIGLIDSLKPLATLGTAGQSVRVNAGATALEYYTPAAGTVTSVSGTTNRITSTGGATPVIDIAATYVGQSSITTLGTITTGVWNGTVVTGQYGGTGVANTGKTITIGGSVTFSGAFTFAGTVTANTAVTFPTSGTLMVNPMTTGGDVIYGGASGVPTRLANGTVGQVLTSGGTTVAPTWEDAGSGGTPSAPDTSVQFNNGGNFGGDADLTWDSTGNNLAITEGLISFNEPTYTVATISSETAALVIQGSEAPTATDDGSGVRVEGGLGGATSGAGGSIFFTAGFAQAGDSDGGDLEFEAGLKSGAGDNGRLSFYQRDGQYTFQGFGTPGDQGVLDFNLITDTLRTYQFPDQSGTVSLEQINPAPANGAYSGRTIAGTAGATLAFGDIIYLAVGDSRWELADASAVSTAGSVLVGFCVLAAAADGDPTTILLEGTIRADTAFPTLTVGAAAFISETSGDITNTAPVATDSVTRVVGHALDGNTLLLNISPDWVTHT